MTFVTRMKLQSGDRAALDALVSDIRSTAERKGAELKGPHSSPQKHVRVPQYKSLSHPERGQFEPWDYDVYTRTLEIIGHNSVAKRVARDMEYPRSVHVEVEIEQTRPLGRSN